MSGRGLVVTAAATAVLVSVAAWLWTRRGRRSYAQVAPQRLVLIASGWNGFGQLGLGHSEYQTSAVHVDGPLVGQQLRAVAAGGLHYAGFGVVLTAEGRAWAFGANAKGQLGCEDLQPRLSPVLVPCSLANKIRSVACGTQHTVFITADGVALSVGVWGWGD
jgi:alpha-tubulin suppressor-like RCC1 family protein